MQTPADPLKVATTLQLLAEIARSSPTATLAAEEATTEAPTMGPTGGPVAEAIAAAEATQTATPSEPHRAVSNARKKIEELWQKKSATVGDNDGFPTFSLRLRNLLLPDKFKPLEITKYDAKQDPIQWLKCYALSIENTGGNNDTKDHVRFEDQWMVASLCDE
jgi:hypothetical protein